MQQLQQKKPLQLSRIESVKDPEVNRALFTLYGNLIRPLSAIEETMDRIKGTKETIASTEGDVTYPLSDAITCGIAMFPKSFPAVFVCLFILAHFIPAVDDLGILGALIFSAIAAAVGGSALLYMTGKSSTASKNRERREAHKRAVDRLSELEERLTGQIAQIQDVICFVPPKYRFSDALNYFVESYVNSRVDDLKEAVNAYDTFYFRSLTADMQRKLLEQEQENAARLDLISYNQLCTMQQLDRIRSDIWLSSIF